MPCWKKKNWKYTTVLQHSLKQSVSLIPICTQILFKVAAVAYSAHSLAAEAAFQLGQASIYHNKAYTPGDTSSYLCLN